MCAYRISHVSPQSEGGQLSTSYKEGPHQELNYECLDLRLPILHNCGKHIYVLQATQSVGWINTYLAFLPGSCTQLLKLIESEK